MTCFELQQLVRYCSSRVLIRCKFHGFTATVLMSDIVFIQYNVVDAVPILSGKPMRGY